MDKVFTLFEFQNNKYCNDKLDYFFKVDHNDPLKSFDLLYKEVHEEFYENGVELKIKEKHRVHKIVLERYHHNLNFVILKIICSTPLIYYKQIREASFAWVLKYLEFILAGNPEMNIIGINNLNEKNLLKYFEVSWNNSYSEYQKFKFLLKRSVQLKSNFIIHKSFFKSIEALITLIYENYPNICSAKKESENKFKVLIIDLFKSKFHKGYLDLFDYLDYLNRSNVISDPIFKDILDSLNIKSDDKREYFRQISNQYTPSNNSYALQFEDPNEIEFEKKLKELKDQIKYRITNSKSIIYNLIVFVKELIYEHEPKAIELESRINKIDASKLKNENGTFLHYMRLLQLENTSAIDSFFNKEKNILKQRIKENSKFDFANYFQNNPLFNSLNELIQKSSESKDFESFNGFLKIKTLLDNWINDENEEITLDKQIEIILNHIIEIIGVNFIKEVNLSVNYKNTKVQSSDDIFFFNSQPRIENQRNLYDFINSSDIENSLNYKMYKGISEFGVSYPLSNFEIIKKGLQIGFRDKTNIENSTIQNSFEFKRITYDCNLLFIRLSDFKTDISNVNILTELNSIAVITIVLDRPERINLKILRLILLLRDPLCQFIYKQIKGHNLLEFISADKAAKDRSLLRHSLDLYLSNLTDAYKSRNDQIFDIVSSAIRGQMDAFKLENNVIERRSIFEIKEHFELIMVSPTIEQAIINNCTFVGFENNKILELDSFIFKIVFLELIINMKRYSPNLNRGFIIEYHFLENVFSFENNIDIEKVNNSNQGVGSQLCKTICEKIGKTLKVEKLNNNKHKVILEI